MYNVWLRYTLLTACILSFLFWQRDNLISRGQHNLGIVELVKGSITTPLYINNHLTRSEEWLRAAYRSRPNQLTQRVLGFNLLQQQRQEEALELWQQTPFMFDELLAWGEQARNQMKTEVALQWFKRAAVIDSQSSEPWYQMGLAYQESSAWHDALEAYTQALTYQAGAGVGRSTIYGKMGDIYRQGLNNPTLAIKMYTMAIEENVFPSPSLKAQIYYRRGEMYGQQQRPFAEQVAEFQQALAINPSHRWALARLGYATYWAYQDLAAAEAALNKALDGWPNDTHQKYPHLFLARIYEDAGLLSKALKEYEEVLAIDKNLADAQTGYIRVKEQLNQR